ncbi:MAG TPA: helix-turn-helix transcriptional regulator [Gemmatimonadales bacterium]|nr:helix-turn-helix transcriptional regulator [Gemmatimonadales bacterium]
MSAITTPCSLLATARHRAGLTQRELAERAGTAQSVVARIESGRTSPTFETLERLVRAAGSSLRLDLAEPPAPDLGPDPVIEHYKQKVDRARLRENLKKTPDQRIREMITELEALREEL